MNISGHCVEKVLENDTIASVYGRDDVRDILIENMKNKEDISMEDLIKETTEQMEKTAEEERTHEDDGRRIS